MKLLFVLLSAWLFTASPVWLTNFETAKTEAATSNKLIILNFSGSDWCGPCIRLRKEIFESDAFTKYAADNLELVNADFPRLKKHELPKEQIKQNDELADKYNPKGRFPYTLLLDAQGKVLKTWDGFPDETAEKFIDEINAAHAH